MFVRAYLRASTKEQDAGRAKGALRDFAKQHGLKVAAWYVENESGASLRRPELFRLLDDCQPGDVLLVEQVDRLSRLSAADWTKLRAEIKRREVVIVSPELPTSLMLLTAKDRESFIARFGEALNDMLLDVLAAVARKDYEDRRRRQKEGIERAQEAAKYKGRRENVERNAAISAMIVSKQSWSTIQAATGCSRSTIARLAKRAPVDA